MDEVKDERREEAQADLFEQWREKIHLEDPKEPAEQAKSEYQNCIILQGEFSNTILNKGCISGGISQNARDGAADQAQPYHFSEEEEIHRLLRNHKDEKERLDFLCLVFLEIIPLSLLGKIREDLRSALGAAKQEEGGGNTVFSSLDGELRRLGMQRVKAMRKGAGARKEMECLMFQEELCAKDMGRVVWKDYLDLRTPILEWLLEIKKKKDVVQTLFYQIAEAFARIMEYDFPFAMETVFPRLVREGGYRDRDILVYCLKALMKRRDYGQELNRELSNGIKRKDSFLWQVSYRLYDHQKPYGFQQETEQEMVWALEKDMRTFGELTWEPRARWRDNVDFYPAYYNREVERLFLESILALFSRCSKQRERTLFGYYFCWLFREDFNKEGYPGYQLMLLACLREKEIRNRAREMYVSIWRSSRFRRLLAQVLRLHFQELEKAQRPWEYMKDYFKTVAFTGVKADFEDTVRCLESMGQGKEPSKTAGEIRNWLCELIELRRKRG